MLFTSFITVYSLQAPPPPDKAKELLNLTKSIQPGLRSMHGTDENRAAARHTAFGLLKRIADNNIFITISPDTGSTYVVSINSTKLEDRAHVDFQIKMDTREKRKTYSSDNPYQSAMYASRVLDAFILDFLGWDMELKAPKKVLSSTGKITSGALGVLRHFCVATEAQKNGDIHFHIVASIAGCPRTTEEFKDMMEDPTFLDR